MSDKLKVRAFRALDELATIRPHWDLLVPRARTASVFSTWEWLASWWRAYASHLSLLALSFWTPSSSLVGMALLQIGTRHVAVGPSFRLVRLMGDGSFDSDGLDFPAAPGYEEAIADSLLGYLSEQRDHWDICEFNTMPADSPVALALCAAIRRSGWPRSTYYHPGAVISLPGSWASYLEGLSKKERDKLRYYTRRLAKGRRVEVSRCASEGDLSVWLDDLYRLHQKRWAHRGQTGTLLLDARRQFYKDMATSFLGRGWLEFWRLRVGSETVATQFGFRYGASAFALQEGFDPDYYSSGVGYLLRGHVLKELIEQGAERYDFLAGESASKSRWGTRPTVYLSIRAARPFTKGALYLSAARRGGTSKEWLRARLPHPVWAGLRRTYRIVRPKPMVTSDLILE